MLLSTLRRGIWFGQCGIWQGNFEFWVSREHLLFCASCQTASNLDPFGKALEPLLNGLIREGHMTLRDIAKVLNALGIRTRRGGIWHVSTVSNLLKRARSPTK